MKFQSVLVLFHATHAFAAQISAGYEHSVFLHDSGEVYSAGGNSKGQLGTGDTTASSVFVKTNISGNITDISARLAKHTLFRRADGEVLGTGWNYYYTMNGVTGDRETDVMTPTELNISGVQSVHASMYLSFYMTSAGKVTGQGYAAHKYLGAAWNRRRSCVTRPLEVNSNHTFTSFDKTTITPSSSATTGLRWPPGITTRASWVTAPPLIARTARLWSATSLQV